MLPLSAGPTLPGAIPRLDSMEQVIPLLLASTIILRRYSNIISRCSNGVVSTYDLSVLHTSVECSGEVAFCIVRSTLNDNE